MNIQPSFNLKNHNTFGIDVTASYFGIFTDLGELNHLLDFARQKDLPVFVLGGGSNILFTGHFHGLVIHNQLKGIESSTNEDNSVLVKSMAGEIWHDLVDYCLQENFGGIENLSLIPGYVGAAPIQNIGAYGVELKDVFVELEAMEKATRNIRVFNSSDCNFGYRDSIFKNELKNQFIILSVTLKLSKNHQFHITYGSIKETLKKLGHKELTIQHISEAVCHIRRIKLPDPAEIGNAGSFFKNPEIDLDQFSRIQKDNPDIPFYALGNKRFKIPAAWLIEQCGWKGKRKGDAGTHVNQPLVLVNYKNANGQDIQDIANGIKKSVFEFFGINLQEEVNIL